ncbi:MAG: NAD(P)-dependent oxidoreductase [Lentisphaeria bacterium]|jgi:D-3-phosphoglycerate dehydrogenase
MKNVLIPTKLESVAKELLASKGFAVVQDADSALVELARAYPDTEALIVRSEKVDAAVIDTLPKLRVVIRAGAGYDNIDCKYARKRGIDVMNTPGANANGVAEEVIAMVLAHYRHIIPADASTRLGKWEKKHYMGRELANKTLGIVGMGNIGRLVAKRLEGFEVKVLAYDPVLSADKAAELGAELVALERLFQAADIITLHVPQTPETKGMVNRSLLQLAKPGAVIVNCSRAGIVNEADLRALKAEKKLGFLNDVYPEDAPGPKSCTDIADIMLPHLGASTTEANWTAAKRSAEQLIAYGERGVTTYVVNKSVPDGLDEQYQQLAYHLAAVARQFLGPDLHINRIECSFYGDLHPFGKWFLPPIAAALSSEFDSSEARDAEAYLAGRGITHEIREIDETKKYGNSMTLDFTAGTGDLLHKVSLRGTITEGHLMISRINDFDKLYFPPEGHTLMAVYVDRPGVLAKITGALAAAEINIEDIRSPHSSDGKRSLAMLKVNKPVPAAVIERIKAETGASPVAVVSIV